MLNQSAILYFSLHLKGCNLWVCSLSLFSIHDNSLIFAFAISGPGGDLRVYLEGLVAAENVQEYIKQNPFGQRAITEKNLSWGYYRKVIEASSTPPRKPDDEDDSWHQTV